MTGDINLHRFDNTDKLQNEATKKKNNNVS